MRIGRMAQVAASLGLATALAGAALAPNAAAAAAKVDARAVVAEVRKLVAEHYVVPGTRATIDAALARGLADGRYDVSEPGLLAERINADLSAASNDGHLGISYDPVRAAQATSAVPDQGPPPELIAAFEREAQERNHGITELRVLPGNIRYINYEGFAWTGPASAAALDDAMRFLKGGEAAIIDLRRNGGGSPQAVQYVISHFMEADRPLVTFHMGGAGEVHKVSTLKDLPAGRMVGKPLYVLTSGGSASAAEEFTGHVSGFKLGETIGETTAGAAFRNTFFPVAGTYMLSVSVGRPELAATGGDWEGKGFAPTVPARLDQALEVAHIRALRKIAGAAPAPQKAALESLATVIQARMEPIAPARPLGDYAGTYGERTVSVEGSKLLYQRQGGLKTSLIALGLNSFALDADPTTRVEFTPAGAMELIRANGSRSTYERAN